MKLTKVILKVLDEGSDQVEWVHLCYVNNTLYKAFLEKFKCEPVDLCDYLSKWALSDFNIRLAMTTRKDIIILKELILDRCKRAHPNIFIAGKTDRQGWVRVWVTNQMEKELKNYAK